MMRIRRTVILGMLLAGICDRAVSFTNYVSLHGSHTAPYTNWATSATNIQAAVDLATNGCTVLVSNGTYVLSTHILITNGIEVIGINGWQNTIVDGNNSVRCFWLRHPDALVRGFTITRAYVCGDNYPAFMEGGGVQILNGGTVMDCMIKGNSTHYCGGGVAILATGQVRNCVVSSNTATWGGGIDADVGLMGPLQFHVVDSIIENNCAKLGGGIDLQGFAQMSNCVVRDNRATRGGGGSISAVNCGAMVVDTVFSGNSITNETGFGGAFRMYGGTLRNCLVIGNTAPDLGGGINISSGLVENCTIVGNEADASGSGGGVYMTGGAMTNCIVYYNSAGTYSNIAGTWTNNVGYCCSTDIGHDPDGTGNMTTEPLFVDAGSGYGSGGHVPGDYHLSSGSPCRDFGTNESWMTHATDLDGSPRIVNYRADVGCYEYVFSTNDYDGDGLSNDEETSFYFTDQTVANTDGDPLDDGDEVIAGTDPTNEASYFVISDALVDGNGHTIVKWYGVTDRFYSVSLTTDLLIEFEGIVGQSNLPGANATMCYTNTTPKPAEFYRIRVSRP